MNDQESPEESTSEGGPELERLVCWMDATRICGADCVAYQRDRALDGSNCIFLHQLGRINIHLSRIASTLVK